MGVGMNPIKTIRRCLKIRREFKRIQEFGRHLNDVAAAWGMKWSDKEVHLLDYIYNKVEEWAENELNPPESAKKADRFDRRLKATRTGKSLQTGDESDWRIRQTREDVCRAQRRTGKAR